MPIDFKQFKSWRGEKAEKERNIFQLAVTVGLFVEEHRELSFIEQAMQADKPVYEEWNSIFKDLSTLGWAMACHCSWAITQGKNCLSANASDQDTNNFDKFDKRVADFYAKGIGLRHTEQKIISFLDECKDFLSLRSSKAVDKQQFKFIALSLFVLFSVGLKMMDKVGGLRSIIWVRVSKPLVKEKISLLLDKIKRCVEALDRAIARPVEKTPQDYFNERYLRLLQDTINHSERVNRLQKDISKVTKAITALAKLKNEKVQNEMEIANVESMLAALATNGRGKENIKVSDLLSVIKNNKSMIEQMHGSKKAQWETDVKQLEESYFPTLRKQSLAKQCKEILIELTNEHLSHLKIQETLINNQHREKIGFLCKDMELADMEAFKAILLDPKPEQLTRVLNANEAICRLLTEYQAVTAATKIKKICLDAILGDTLQLEQVIKINDSLWVWLSNFLAKICSLFQSEKGCLVSEAKKLKAELQKRKENYENEIKLVVDQITEKDGFSESFERELIKEFDHRPIMSKAKPVDKQGVELMRQKYKSYSTTFLAASYAMNNDAEEKVPAPAVS